MQLTYRGQVYTASHKTASVNTEKRFTYRGQSYQRSASIAVTPKANLTYRGIPCIQPEPSNLKNFNFSFS